MLETPHNTSMYATLDREPLRGVTSRQAMVDASEDVLLLVPGRPQAKLRADDGSLLSSGQHYYDQVQKLARLSFGVAPLYESEAVPIRLELYYPFSEELAGDIIGKPVSWYLQSIPNANTAPTIILSALVGHLYAHSSQVEPLTVTRTILTVREITARFGAKCRRGVALVKYG